MEVKQATKEKKMIITNDILINVLLNSFPDTITRLSEARRFILLGIVKVNGETVSNENKKINHGDTLELGRRFKIIL